MGRFLPRRVGALAALLLAAVLFCGPMSTSRPRAQDCTEFKNVDFDGLLKAARAGSAAAQNKLARAIERGCGGLTGGGKRRDYWFCRAALGGHRGARKELSARVNIELGCQQIVAIGEPGFGPVQWHAGRDCRPIDRPDGRYRTATASKLRQGPGTGSRSLARLPKGTLVEVDGSAEGGTWLRVRMRRGTIGYIYYELLEPVKGGRFRYFSEVACAKLHQYFQDITALKLAVTLPEWRHPFSGKAVISCRMVTRPGRPAPGRSTGLAADLHRKLKAEG